MAEIMAAQPRAGRERICRGPGLIPADASAAIRRPDAICPSLCGYRVPFVDKARVSMRGLRLPRASFRADAAELVNRWPATLPLRARSAVEKRICRGKVHGAQPRTGRLYPR